MTGGNTTLIIKLGAMGDIVQAEGALHDLRIAYPADRIIALTTRGFRAWMERCPWVDAVEIDARRPRWDVGYLLDLRARLRALRPARVFDLQNSGRTAFYRRFLLPRVWWCGRAAGATVRAPYDNREGPPGLVRLEAQLAAAGIATQHAARPDPSWMADPVDDLLAAHDLRPGGFVALLAGTSQRSIARRWPHYGALADRLSGQGLRCVTVPGPGEEALCSAIPATMLTEANGSPLSLWRLTGVIAAAAAVVGNDTGPTHIAAYLGKPGVVVFGPTSRPETTSLDAFGMEMLVTADLASLNANQVATAFLRRMPATGG